MAIIFGMRRGSRIKPPCPAMTPTFTSVRPNLALLSATTRWQVMAISSPPPTQKPFTAAMMGLVMSPRMVRPPNPAFGMYTVFLIPHFKSLPLQNDSVPAPVMMATHSSGSAKNALKASSSSSCAGGAASCAAPAGSSSLPAGGHAARP